jgi:hypothetical protein
LQSSYVQLLSTSIQNIKSHWIIQKTLSLGTKISMLIITVTRNVEPTFYGKSGCCNDILYCWKEQHSVLTLILLKPCSPQLMSLTSAQRTVQHTRNEVNKCHTVSTVCSFGK